MANKIDSNIVGLSYAKEQSLQVLPATPVWQALEPNSFSDFGAQIKTVAREPINPSRQRKKGVLVGFDCSGSFESDFTQTNFQDLLQGFLFANARTKGSASTTFPSGDVTITVGSGVVTLSSTVTDFTTLDLVVGEYIFVGGDTSVTQLGGTNSPGFGKIVSIDTNQLMLTDITWIPATDSNAGKTVQIFHGEKVIRNEKDPDLIIRSSYQLERTVGKDNDGTMSEYLVGAIPNEFKMTIKQEDKITCSLGFVAMDAEYRSGADGIKAGTRVDALSEDAYNTSSDIYRIKLSIVDPTTLTPTPLFAFVTDAEITIANNVTPNKAVSVLGAFDATAGMFDVSGKITAYFADVEAIAAIRNNSSVALSILGSARNGGFSIDIPLLTLGDGRLQVEKDAAITIPLDTTAAECPDGYTVMFTFFNSLPDVAMA